MSGIPKPLDLRITEKISIDEDGCWIWTGGINQWGRGFLTIDKKHKQAHRVAYEAFVGPIPEGLEIDHLCGVPRCVNPDHLQPVTHLENMRRHYAWKGHHNAIKTHCVNGHEFTPENTRLDADGHRQCRACIRPIQAAAQRRYRARNREAQGKVWPKTHCKHGHEFTPENTKTDPNRTGRICRTCARERAKENTRRYRERLARERGPLP